MKVVRNLKVVIIIMMLNKKYFQVLQTIYAMLSFQIVSSYYKRRKVLFTEISAIFFIKLL